MNPTIQNTIKKFLDHSLDRGLINEDIYNFLSRQDPKTPIIYFVKKTSQKSYSCSIL